MMPIFIWAVTAMDCYPVKQGKADVVFNVHWTCASEQGGQTVSVYGTCQVPDGGGQFTPYEQLTEKQVLNWIWVDGVSKDKIETNVANKLNKILNPTSVTPLLPWAQEMEKI